MRLHKRTKRRLAALIVAAITCTIGFSAITWARHAQQQRLVVEARAAGLAAYNAGDLSTTLQHLSYYFQYEKSDLEANLAFAEARARTPLVGGRHLLEAIDLYSNHGLRLLDSTASAEDHAPQRWQILNRLLDLHSQAGFRFEVIQVADRLLQIDQDHLPALGAKAEALCLQREFEAAAPLVAHAMELDPDSLRWRRLFLEIMAECGVRADQRIEQCKSWAEEYSGDGRFHALMAGILLALDRTDEGRRELHLAAARGASTQEVLQGTVELLDLIEERDAASVLIQTTIKAHEGSDWPWEVCVRRLWRANELEDALASIHLAESRCATFSLEMLKLNSMVAGQAGRQEEAAKWLDELDERSRAAATHDGLSQWVTAVRSVLQDSRSDWSTQLARIQSAITYHPRDPFLHLLLGHLWLTIGEVSQALQSYAKAAAFDPLHVAASIAHADTLRSAGRFQEAFAVSRDLVSRAPRDQLEPTLVLARCYLSLRRSSETGLSGVSQNEVAEDLLEVLEHSFREQPHHAHLALTLAEAYADLRSNQIASEFVTQLLADDQISIIVLEGIADLCIERQLAARDQALSQLEEREGNTPEIAFRFARIAAAEGKPEHGLQVIDDALINGGTKQAIAQHWCMRTRFMLEHELPGADIALAKLVAEYPDHLPSQYLALWHTESEESARLANDALSNVRTILGAESPQVRLAEAHLRLQGYQKDDATLARSIVQIEGVLTQTPDSLAALSLMADAMMKSRPPNIQRAIECLERAVALYNDQPMLTLRLIALLQQRGNLERAGQHLQALARRPRDLSIRSAELQLWQRQADFESALAFASRMIDDQSSQADQLIYAAMQHRAGNIQAAQDLYDRLLAGSERNALILSQAADFYASTGRFERGMELMMQLVEQQSAESTALSDVQLGSFCHRYGRAMEAGEILRRAVRTNPQSADACDALAQHYLAMQNRNAAREESLRGLKLEPDHQSLRTTLAAATLSASDQERHAAIATLRTIGGSNQDLLALLELLASVQFHDGKPMPHDINLLAARRLIEVHASFLPIWQVAVLLHAQAGRVGDAVRIARSAINRFPDRVEPCQWSTQLLMESSKWREALAEALEWRSRAWRSGNDPVASDAIIAAILLELQRPTDALAQLEPHHALLWEQRQQYPGRLALWLRCLAMTGRFDEATQLIDPLLQDSSWRMQWIQIASQFPNEYVASALHMLDRCTLTTDEAEILAYAWIDLERTIDCPECLDRAEERAAQLALPHDDKRVLMLRAALAERKGDWEAAATHYRRILQQDSQDAVASNNLAFVLRESGKHDEALQFADLALKLAPGQPEFTDTKAVILMAINRTGEAQRLVQDAVQKAPQNLSLRLALAETQLSLQQWDDLERTIAELKQLLAIKTRYSRDVHNRYQQLRTRIEASVRPHSASAS